MATLVWDVEEERIYQTGLDHGVLYTGYQGALAVPWNGLSSVNVNSNQAEVTEVYFNGTKTYNLVTPDSFAGKLKAFTYPDEFLPFIGQAQYYPGAYLENQPINTFHLSWRTLIGNPIEGTSFGYQIHLLYNVTAMPEARTFGTMTNDVSPMEFSWDITSIPEAIASWFYPSAHYSLSSRKVDETTMSRITDALYGTELTEPYFPTLDVLLGLLLGGS